MNLVEILKANGIEDDVITKITADMKANRVFTAGEDNLDIRYSKLKNENAQNQQTINDLKTQLAEIETLKSQLDEAGKSYTALEAENAKIKLDNALERALIEAKVQDVDYMKFKLKEKHPDGFKLDENGKIEKKIEEKKLEKSDENPNGISREDFAKMNYHERAKLFKENPEQYAELNK